LLLIDDAAIRGDGWPPRSRDRATIAMIAHGNCRRMARSR
jgi:hypothetical protein